MLPHELVILLGHPLRYLCPAVYLFLNSVCPGLPGPRLYAGTEVQALGPKYGPCYLHQ